MAKRYHLKEGIIIRRQSTTNGDVIITLLSPDGKWRGIARKGKIVGGNIGRLSLFHDVSLQYYQVNAESDSEDIYLITQVALNGALPKLSQPDIYPLGHLLCELCDKLTVGVHLGEKLYDYLSSGLRGITQHSQPDKVALVYAWKLLSQAGLAPRLNRCHTCRESYSETTSYRLDVANGVLLCTNCSSNEQLQPYIMPVSERTVMLLVAIHTKTVRQALDLAVSGLAVSGLAVSGLAASDTLQNKIDVDMAKHWVILKHYTNYHVAELQSLQAVTALVKVNVTKSYSEAIIEADSNKPDLAQDVDVNDGDAQL